MGIFGILGFLLGVAWVIVLAHVVMSWLINFEVLSLRQPFVAQIWDGLNRLLEPVYGRLRRYIPSVAGLDFAPLVALIGLMILRGVIDRAAIAFG